MSELGNTEARGAVAISLGQAAMMLMGGVLALLITQFFGKGAGTDAFFTAYGFYVIALSFAQTLRLTALPRLMGDIGGDEESRLLAATALMALAAAVPMVLLAGPLGKLIANGDPSGVATQTLRLLWPALALQLIAGVLVPMLTLREIYVPIGSAFTLAGIASVIAFVLLQPELGIKAVSVGLALSAALLATSLALTLRGDGWRVRAKPFTDLRSIVRDGMLLTVSSASFLVFNLGYLICLAVANHEQRGSATTYAYAFFAASFLVAVTAVPSAMVRAPRLLDAGGDRGVTGDDVVSDFRLALVLLVPAFGLAAALAAPFTELIAGGFFGAGDAQHLANTLLVLAPWVLASVAGIMVVLELLNRGRVSALAWIATVHGTALIPLAIGGRIGLGIVGIALAQSLAMCLATAAQIRLAFSAQARSLLTKLTAEALRATLIGVLCLGPGWLIAEFVSNAVGIIIIVGGLAGYLFAARRLFAREWQILASILPRRN